MVDQIVSRAVSASWQRLIKFDCIWELFPLSSEVPEVAARDRGTFLETVL